MGRGALGRRPARSSTGPSSRSYLFHPTEGPQISPQLLEVLEASLGGNAMLMVNTCARAAHAHPSPDGEAVFQAHSRGEGLGQAFPLRGTGAGWGERSS